MREVNQSGWTQTTADPADITATSGDNVANVDFGNFHNTSISGRKFEDENGDGSGAGDSGLGGWTIFLDANNNGALDAGETNTATAADGSYSFTNLGPGTYVVREVNQAGWTQTTSSPAPITPTSGDDVANVDFGNFHNIAISGRKFEDENGDGDGTGDSGLGGWTIFLDANNNGALDAGETNTTTAADGSYGFTNLGPGTYRVREVNQAGWTQTTANPADISATSGANVANVNFGNFQLVTISGQKFNDLDGNGQKDAGEPGLPDWTIQLDIGGVDQYATTDANGNYSFSGVGPGDYQLSEVQQFGWTQTFPVAPGVYNISTQSGMDVGGRDFGNTEFIKVSGQKFNDVNGNGQKDAGEPGLAGWTIDLDLNNDGSTDQMAVTDADGNYSFDFVPPGTHVVSEEPQAGWTQTFPASPATYTIVAQATDISGLDFGNFQLVTLSGQKFEDTNGNGVKDAGEAGLPNWMIALDLNNDGVVDQTTPTDQYGNYSFSGVGPGTHKISEVQQVGWVQTVPASPGVYVVTTQSGADVGNQDFGNFHYAEAHGRKYNDQDADGTDNGGTDPGIAGITIQLVGTDGAGNPVSLQTTTLADGTYAFTGLTPGSYSVLEMSPVGYAQTAPVSGSYSVVLTSGDVVQGLDFGNHYEGAAFDFNDLNSPTADGYVPVPSFFTFDSGLGYGWQTSPPQSGFDRGAPDDLRRDGHYGSADNTFQVAVPNGVYRVDLVIGDQQYGRNNIDVFAEDTLVVSNLSFPAGDFMFPAFVATVTDGRLDVRFHDRWTDGAGGDPFWVINALEVQPLDALSHHITTPGGTLVADGVTEDTFNGTGATPNSLVTVSTDYGAVVSPDVDPGYDGVQVLADANGQFSFKIRRSTGAATADILTKEVNDLGAGAATQDYGLQDTRQLDFNNNASPTAVGAFGVDSFLVYNAEQGFGWQTAPPQSGFDRGAPDDLLRDGHYGSADNTFLAQVVPGATYQVTLQFRDVYARNFIDVFAEGTPVIDNLDVPANTTVTPSFMVSSTDDQLAIRFHNDGGDAFWIINGIELTLVPPPAPELALAAANPTPVIGRTAGGQWWLATSDGSSLNSQSYGAWSPDAGWRDVTTGDFDGDGQVDVLGRTASGQWWLGHNTGSTFENQYYGSWYEAANWRDVQIGDFDGDGLLDVLGRTATGQWWLGHNTGSTFESQYFGSWDEAAGWRDVATGDFNSDGQLDIAGRTATGGWWIGSNTGSTFANQYFGAWYEGAGWQNVQVGDFDGDHRDDILGQTSGGAWWLSHNTGGGGFQNIYVGDWDPTAGWQDVLFGDFTGDGATDVLGRTAGGQWWLGANNGFGFTNQLYGFWSPAAGWQDVVTGDFNGDGRLDILGRTSGGGWWMGDNTGSAFANEYFGAWSPDAGWQDVQALSHAATEQAFNGGVSQDDLALAAALAQQDSSGDKPATDAAFAQEDNWLGL